MLKISSIPVSLRPLKKGLFYFLIKKGKNEQLRIDGDFYPGAF
jgi:hypothetical protein